MSKKPRLWISRFLSQLTLDRARENFEVYLPKIDRPASKNEMVELSSKVDAFLICHSEIISSDVAKNFNKRLKIIANHSVGTDHCDLDALKSIGIVVTMLQPKYQCCSFWELQGEQLKLKILLKKVNGTLGLLALW